MNYFSFLLSLCKKTPKYFVILIFDSVIPKAFGTPYNHPPKADESLVFRSFLSKTSKSVVFLQTLLTVILLFTETEYSFSQDQLSNIACENLEGEAVSIPSSKSESHQLLIFAFGKSNEKELQSWLQPVYEKFIEKSGLLDMLFDVELSLVSVLNSMEATAAKANRQKIKQEIDKDLHRNVYQFKGDETELLKALNIEKKQLVVLLLDSNGKILYKTTGKYSEDKMEAIEDLLD
jgi:hypothetical protein